MPQISKIRIVNLRYNGDTRLMPDILFDLSNSAGDKALNTLIDMTNGGGKTTLVHAIMQPIIPKAKIAGRKIEDFFVKPNSHAFVLLEWILDDSTEKLMTGISIASSKASKDGSDEGRSRGIKYYTFLSNYTNYDGNYDIVNLPLSKIDNNVFFPAEFDFVRNLAKNSHGALCYYSDDQSTAWAKKLAEYKIDQAEWRQIEAINEREGGMSEAAFQDCGTSDKLINKYMIPAIERKLNPGNASRSDDTSLDSMFSNYVKQCESQKDVLRNRDTCEKFVKLASDIKPDAEALWNQNHEVEEQIQILFGLQDGINKECESCENQKTSLKEQKITISEKQRKLRHERLSAAYYEALAIFEESATKFQQVEARCILLDERQRDTKAEIRIQESAYYAEQLKPLMGEIDGLRKEIYRSENGGENKVIIANLKYSISTQVYPLLDQFEAESDNLETFHNTTRTNLALAERQCGNAKYACEQAKEKYNRADERLSGARFETDQHIKKYGLNITRNFYGAYGTDDIDDLLTENRKQTEAYKRQSEQCDSSLTECEAQLDLLPDLRSAAISQRDGAIAEQKLLIQALSVYKKLQSSVHEICDEHNFADYVDTENYLQSAIPIKNSEISAIQRKIAVLEEEITAAKRGSLHVPNAVISYISTTGVLYDTCENYLISQVKNGSITAEQCEQILQKYPAAAYGILMDSTQRKKFFEYGREEWLPAMIPLYDYTQMERILQNQQQHDGAIAFYAEDYFHDTEQFVGHLERKKEKEANQRNAARRDLARIEEQLKVLHHFAEYDQDFAVQTTVKIDALSQVVQKAEQEMLDIDRKKEDYKRRKAQIQMEKAEIDEGIRICHRQNEATHEVSKRIAREKELEDLRYQANVALEQAKRELSEQEVKVNNLKNQLESIRTRIQFVNVQLEQLRAAKNEIGICIEAQLVEGAWSSLLEQYRTLQAAVSRDLKANNDLLKEKQERAKSLEKELKDRAVDPEVYEDVLFDVERLSSLRADDAHLSAELQEARANLRKEERNRGKAENQKENAHANLSEFGGEPLAKCDIGSNFDAREQTLQNELQQIKEELESLEARKHHLVRCADDLGHITRILARPGRISAIPAGKDPKVQCGDAILVYQQYKCEKDQLQQTVEKKLAYMQEQLEGTTYGVLDAVMGMRSILESEARGDRYYTLTVQIDAGIENANRAIGQINTDLQDITNSFNDLVHQCVLQGERIYEGLKQISNSSRVTVYEGEPKKQMLRIILPSNIDPEVAETTIADELEKGTKEIIHLRSEGATDGAIANAIKRTVSSETLLRK